MADLLVVKDESPCCSLWKAKYAKLQQKNTRAEEGRSALKQALAVFESEYDKMKKDYEKEKMLAEFERMDKEKESAARVSLENEIYSLKSQFKQALAAFESEYDKMKKDYEKEKMRADNERNDKEKESAARVSLENEISSLKYEVLSLSQKGSSVPENVSEELKLLQGRVSEQEKELKRLQDEKKKANDTCESSKNEKNRVDQELSKLKAQLLRVETEKKQLEKELEKEKGRAFPHYEDLCTVFGNNRARGNGTKDCGDAEKEAHIEVLESNEEGETMMEGSHDAPRKTNVQVKDNTNIEVDETSNLRCKKRKRQVDPYVDGLENVAKLLGFNLKKVSTTISRDIDFEEDLKKKKTMTTNEIFKMESLSQQEKYEAMEKIRRDIGYVEAYWDMYHEYREGWVKYILLKD